MSNVAVSSLSKTQVQSLSLAYASLLLSDAKKEITADHLTSILKSANLEVNKTMVDTFAAALKGKDVSRYFTCGGGASSGSSGQSAPAKNDVPAAAGKKEEPKKVEEKPAEEEDMDMGGLFD